MFKISNFQAGAAVVVEGKTPECFFILRQGEANVSPEIPIPGEEGSQLLKAGDFFGVVACMSGHPHIETAQTTTVASMIAVSKDEFGTLIQRNAPIAMKIIRYFSQRLRIVDKAITRLSFHNTVEENPQLMYQVGEYYYERQHARQSVYAYQKYLQYFPRGSYAEKAKDRLSSMSAPVQASPVKRNNLAATFRDKEIIFIEHEPGFELYIIQQGSVKITKVVEQNEVLLAVLKPGDIFGEMALLENKPRSATAIAHGNILSLAINKANFETMVQAQPQLAVKLITILSERIWTAYRQLSNLLISDPIGRLYDLLLTLVQKKKIPIYSKATHTFDVGTSELSNMLGYAPEKGDAYVMKLLENKDFSLDAGKVICSNLVELEKQVQFYRKKSSHGT